MDRLLAAFISPPVGPAHDIQVQAFHHAMLLGLVGVLFAALLSLALYWATHGKLTFEAFMVGPECAVAAAGLSFHRILDNITPGGFPSIFSNQAIFFLSLVVISIGAYLITHDYRVSALKYLSEPRISEKSADSALRFLVNLRYTIAGWVRRTRIRMRLLNYLVVNLSLGGLPMFLSAAGHLPTPGHF
jgi:hypothetical protein